MLASPFDQILDRFTNMPVMLQKMRLLDEVEQKIAGKEDVISLGIKTCIYNKIPTAKILNDIKEMAQDNYYAIGFLIGKKLTDKILTL